MSDSPRVGEPLPVGEPLLVDEPPLVDEPLSPPVISTELDFAGRVWDVRRDVFDYNGHEITRDYVDHPGAVAVLVLDDDDRALLIQQYRHPIRSRDWEIPAGLLDIENEDPLVASDWSELVTFYSSPGGSNELIRVFLARGISATPQAFDRHEEEADILIRWAPLEDIRAGVLDGRLRNSILAIAVLAAHARS